MPDDWELFWVVEESLAGRGGAGGVGIAELAPLLPPALLAAAAALLSISAPKLSLPCEGSLLAGRGGATWKVGGRAASDVTLNTGRPLAMKLAPQHQQDPGHPRDFVNPYIFQLLNISELGCSRAAAPPFFAQRQDLPFAAGKADECDCLARLPPILESSFSIGSEKADTCFAGAIETF